MVEEKIIEEIYSVLVERFGVGEIFLPKYKARKDNITWIDFIKVALITKTSEELAKYCSYSSKDNFSEGTRYKYPSITKDKSRRLWKDYLLYLINSKRCSICNTILSIDNFYSSSRDKFRSECKSCGKDYYISNIETITKDKHNSYVLNKADYIARAGKYRAVKLEASPLWADQEKVKQIYKECPEGYHVDHIVPLQNDLVCGLHCEFNLQHLPAAENLSKSNKFDIDKQE